MPDLKKKIYSNCILIIEKLGLLINPIILNFTNENDHLLIFYFHGLYESDEQKNLNHIDPQNNLTVHQFINFIEYFLHHKYTFIRPEDLLKDLPQKPYIIITFDDGYFNNTLAIQILNKYKIPATFFIAARNILENKSYWWDVIYKFRTKESVVLETIRKEQEHLKSFKFSYIENYIEQNFGPKSSEPWSDIDRPLNVMELKNFSQNPYVTIGNHTHNHSILTNYDRQEITNELALCNDALFKITGRVPNSIAFPNGNFNDLVKELAKEGGFKYAFSTKAKLNTLPISNRNDLIFLDRFIAQTSSINNYGSFSRLGHSSSSLYSYLIRPLKSISKL